MTARKRQANAQRVALRARPKVDQVYRYCDCDCDL